MPIEALQVNVQFVREEFWKSREGFPYPGALLGMNSTTDSINKSASSIVVSGPPAMAKAGSVIAAAVAVGAAFAWPNPVAISATILGAVVAWRLARLAIIIQSDELILRNLFATSCIPIANAEVKRVSSDLRLRTEWGAQILPSDFMPKMDDDNMATHATIIRINDLNDSDFSAHTDCSIGLLPATQDELFNELKAIIEGAGSR